MGDALEALWRGCRELPGSALAVERAQVSPFTQSGLDDLVGRIAGTVVGTS